MSTLSRLDNEYLVFLKSQSAMKLGRTKEDSRLTVEDPDDRILNYLDTERLQERLKQYSELSFTKAELEYLEFVGEFKPAFLAYLAKQTLPTPNVTSTEGKLQVEVEGKLGEIIFWEPVIEAAIRELYFEGWREQSNIEDGLAITEAAGRFEKKFPLLDGQNLALVDDGSRYRMSSEWYSVLLILLVGSSLRRQLLGTTNVLMALSYALPPIAYLDEAEWLSAWDYKTIAPAPEFCTSEWDGSRIQDASITDIEKTLLENDLTDKTLVLSGRSAFEMAHLRAHIANPLVFEWQADLTCDIGAGRVDLISSREG